VQQEMIADYLAHDLKAFTSKTIDEADFTPPDCR